MQPTVLFCSLLHGVQLIQNELSRQWISVVVDVMAQLLQQFIQLLLGHGCKLLPAIRVLRLHLLQQDFFAKQTLLLRKDLHAPFIKLGYAGLRIRLMRS